MPRADLNTPKQHVASTANKPRVRMPKPKGKENENPSLVSNVTQAVSLETATGLSGRTQSDSFQLQASSLPSESTSLPTSSSILRHMLNTVAKSPDSSLATTPDPSSSRLQPIQSLAIPSPRNISGSVTPNHHSSVPLQRTLQGNGSFQSASEMSTYSMQRPLPIDSAANNMALALAPHHNALSGALSQPMNVMQYQYINSRDILKQYRLKLYPVRGKFPNRIQDKVRRMLEGQGKELASILRKTYNNNILMLPEDQDMRRPMIQALQKELGYRIPIIDFSVISDKNPRHAFLPYILQTCYEDMRKMGHVPDGKPLVLYLKDTNANSMNIILSETYQKFLFKEHNLRLIIDSLPASYSASHFEMDEHPATFTPDRFQEFRLKALNVSEWANLLKGSHEAERLQKKYHCSLTEIQLKQLLQLLLRKGDGQIDQKDVLSSLDSLGAYRQLKYPGEPRTFIRPISKEDLHEFFEREDLLQPDVGPIQTRFSFELEHDLEDLVGLAEPKKILKRIADQFKYGALAHGRQKGNALVKSMLVDGPPGIGKTMYAEGAAKELEKLTNTPVTFISTSGGVFGTGKKYKEGVDAANRFFDSIENADTPLVVAFVDEVEGIYNRSKSDSANGTVDADLRAATNQFLIRAQKLASTSKKKVLLIYATNNRSKLDSAFVDRIKYETTISLPDKNKQREILRNQFKIQNLDEDDQLIDTSVRRLQHTDIPISGRKLAAFVEELYDEAFDAASNKSEMNAQVEAGLIAPPKFKVTEKMINRVIERLKAQSKTMTDEELRQHGIF